MNAKIHTIYKLKDGTIVPSVTQIVGLLNKPALLEWGWRQGTEGQDIHKIKDITAEAGRLAHQMILDFLNNKKTDFNEYSKEIIDLAENSFLSFLEWIKDKKIEPLGVEVSLVSERYKYGGTYDFYGFINGTLALIDWKTGSGIYPSYIYQISAYRWLLIENGFNDPEKVIIIRVNREPNEKYEELIKKDTSIEFEIFKRLCEIYHLQSLTKIK